MFRSMFLTLVMTAVLSACGGSDSEQQVASTPTPSTPAPEAPAPATPTLEAPSVTEYMALLSEAAQKQAEVESLVSTTPCTASSQCSTLVLNAQTRPCPFIQYYDYSLASTTAAAARAAADAYNTLAVQAAAIEPPNDLDLRGTCFTMVDTTPLSCVANKCVRQFVFDGPPDGPPPEGIWVSGTLQLFVSAVDVVWAIDTAAATPTLYTGPLARQGTNLTATLSQVVGSSETKSSLVATISNTPTPSIRIERLDGITHLPRTLTPVTSYFSPSALSQIAGSYDLSSGERIVADANGSVRSTEPGCTVKGSIQAPWADRNVYYLGITFGPAPCKTPMAFIEGILAPRPDGQLFVAIRRVAPDVAALNIARVN